MAYDPQFQNNLIEGVNRFQNARMQAFWEEVVSLMRGKSAELMSFENIRTRLRLSEESYKGIQDIDIDKIAGSVGRYKDFSRSFLPKRGKMQERWSRIYAQANSLAGLPPIEVYKVGEVYFVRDGNHRVSVARQLKAKTIEAHVTELSTPIYFHSNMSEAELTAAEAYAAFLNETRLKTTRPHHQSLSLTEPSRYGDLMGHIYLHQNILERLEDRPVPLRDAAAHWYDNVYRPAVTLIRKHRILEDISQGHSNAPRTETDLYLWMVDHLRDVRVEYGDSKGKRYSDALVDFLAERKIPIPQDLLHEGDEEAPLTQTQVMRALTQEQVRAGTSGQNPYVSTRR